MDAAELKALQAPLKDSYRAHPETARKTLTAECQLHASDVACEIESPPGPFTAGLHPATGGDGSTICSVDLLLQSLVSCAGVTLKAVSTAMQIPLGQAKIRAEGDLDFRGTLGVSKEVPVGLSSIRLKFFLKTDAPRESVEKLIQLTERYCVVFQTLKTPPTIETVLE